MRLVHGGRPLRGRASAEIWKWAVIGYALGSTARTLRLCGILLVLSVPAPLVLAMLLEGRLP
jgi:hypothetical protein